MTYIPYSDKGKGVWLKYDVHICFVCRLMSIKVANFHMFVPYVVCCVNNAIDFESHEWVRSHQARQFSTVSVQMEETPPLSIC